MSAVMTTREVADTISGGEAGVMMHGPTFMANPLACAIAIESLKMLREQDMARRLGDMEASLRSMLAPAREIEGVADVRVLGSIGVVEMTDPVDVGRFQVECVDRGIWVRPFGRNVYVMPPYVISDEELATLTLPDDRHIERSATMESIEESLGRLARSGNLRVIPSDSSDDGLVDFTSNDYLGLAADRGLQDDFFPDGGRQASVADGVGLAAACLGSGIVQPTGGCSRTHVWPKGVAVQQRVSCQHGLIAALAPAGTLIVADKLVHASIIDGYKLSGADLARFRHNDMAHLESIIRSKSGRYDRILVVTESVFSMDGDSPDMNALVDIRRRYDEVMLYVDEAHGFAVSGPDGLGLTMALDRPGYVDVIVGTFGKAAASIGAFAVMEESVRSYVVNNARSLIFSTVLPPLNAEWTRFVVERLPQMEERRLASACASEAASRRTVRSAAFRFAVHAPESHIQYVVT